MALFNVDGNYYALENACPHQGGPIADGWVEGLTVTCPWHAWCFDLRTGTMTLGDFALIARFEVHVKQDGVYRFHGARCSMINADEPAWDGRLGTAGGAAFRAGAWLRSRPSAR